MDVFPLQPHSWMEHWGSAGELTNRGLRWVSEMTKDTTLKYIFTQKKKTTQLTLVWGCTSTQCYPYLWREQQIINNYKSITHYSKKQILTKDTLPCSPCSYLHSYPTSAQCKYSFLLLGLLSYYFEVFGSVPCSRAAERQLLRKIEHYSFISFFHLMPAKPEPFQSLMHYSHLWAAS